MASLDEPMSPQIFDNLNSCDPNLAWQLCRNYVAFQLLGKDPIAVPFLDESYHIVPFGVIVKKSKRSNHDISTVDGSGKSSYTIIGSMANVTAASVDKTPFHQKPARVFEYNFNQRFVYRITGMKNGVKKAIKIKIGGTECYDVSLSMELGKLVLDKSLRELNNVKKLFIIFEVFYAKSVSVSVTIGEQKPGSQYMETNNRKFANERRMPIGFNAQKFPLMSNGCVGFMEKSNLDGLRNGRWKRSSRLISDPLPSAPNDPNQPGPSNQWRMGGNSNSMSGRRNPHDMLPSVPGNRMNDPLPQPPNISTSSSD